MATPFFVPSVIKGALGANNRLQDTKALRQIPQEQYLAIPTSRKYVEQAVLEANSEVSANISAKMEEAARERKHQLEARLEAPVQIEISPHGQHRSKQIAFEHETNAAPIPTKQENTSSRVDIVYQETGSVSSIGKTGNSYDVAANTTSTLSE